MGQGFSRQEKTLTFVSRLAFFYARGDRSQTLNLPIPRDAAAEMVVATRPNEIALTGPATEGYKTHVEKRIFLTDRTEYLVPVGEQIVKIQTPHRVHFAEGEACCVNFLEPMWYPVEDGKADQERARRQLV